MAEPPPDRGKCKTAIKILEQFERLMRKYRITISPARMQKLKDLRDDGTIQVKDLPAKLRPRFPGELAGLTLDAIRKLCGKK